MRIQRASERLRHRRGDLKIRWQRCRQRQWRGLRKRRRDGVDGIWRLAGQYSQGMAADRDLRIECGDVAGTFGNRPLCRFEFDPGIQAGLESALDKACQVAALLLSLFRERALGDLLGQIVVTAGNIGCQHLARGLMVRLVGAQFADCRFKTGAVLAEKSISHWPPNWSSLTFCRVPA